MPEVDIPSPATTFWKRLGAVRMPFMSTFLLNFTFSRKKLSTFTVKTKLGLIALEARTEAFLFVRASGVSLDFCCWLNNEEIFLGSDARQDDELARQAEIFCESATKMPPKKSRVKLIVKSFFLFSMLFFPHSTTRIILVYFLPKSKRIHLSFKNEICFVFCFLLFKENCSYIY